MGLQAGGRGTHLGPDLVTALAGLNVHDFPHTADSASSCCSSSTKELMLNCVAARCVALYIQRTPLAPGAAAADWLPRRTIDPLPPLTGCCDCPSTRRRRGRPRLHAARESARQIAVASLPIGCCSGGSCSSSARARAAPPCSSGAKIRPLILMKQTEI